MTFAEYQEIVEKNTNWSNKDIYRLTCDCFIKKLTKKECLELIAQFTGGVRDMTRTYKTIYGASATITEHKDGTATLKMFVAGKRTTKKYKNFKSAYAAWYRLSN